MTSNEPIELNLPNDQIRQEAYTLPDGFVWDTMDLEDAKVVHNNHVICFQWC